MYVCTYIHIYYPVTVGIIEIRYRRYRYMIHIYIYNFLGVLVMSGLLFGVFIRAR